MTGKEKLKLALEHKEGPVLFDIGGLNTTGMHCIVMEELRDFYGLEKHPIKIIEATQMLGVMEDDLRECLGVETQPLWGSRTAMGFASEDKYKEWKTPWGQDVLVPEEFVTSVDKNGDTLLYACADTNYPAAARMPKGGVYFDNEDRADEWDEDDYDINDNLEEFTLFTDSEIAWLKKQADALAGTDRVVTSCSTGITGGGTCLADHSMIAGPMLRQPKGIRKLEDFYMATAGDPETIMEIFEKETDIGIQNLKRIHDAIGDAIDVLHVCGTDMGTQKSLFYSKKTIQEVWVPYYKKINGWIHENTNWKTFKHCCGSIEPIIEDLIDGGFDVLNPVQWTAQNMDRNMLKEKYGDKLVFWGGGVDTQHLLPEGTPQQVYDQAKECLSIFSKNGGYVFNTIHNIVPGVSAANVDALARAVRDFNAGR
ncbi:MAG: methyltransferase [Lachnospiraceae bacterium]|nr:methyltransferase [Lachnospiraceae bacterium]